MAWIALLPSAMCLMLEVESKNTLLDDSVFI